MYILKQVFKHKTKAFFILSLVQMAAVSQAQTFELGGGIGVTQYKGDLNPNFNPLLSRPAGHFLGRYNFSNGFSLKTTGLFGMLEGNDNLSRNPLNKERQFKFKALIYELNLCVEYNFFDFRRYGTYRNSAITPTVFAGVGTYGLAKRKYFNHGATDGVNYNSKLSNSVIVYGIGLKRKLSQNWNLSAELGARFQYQKKYWDDIDGIGFPTALGSSPPGYQNSQYLPNHLTSPNTKSVPDMYFYTGVTISYVFYGVRCPNPRR
ncbi:DUF6089 family protein [Marinilongibacter aquaticus]|uniref:type IX secretion system protein PorG n=1 Tax=Marinilongibacter aquaticus TaxID=2975157 RepID=UPI0021BDE039|nr:DUF6089 family protein [Marinilongibacter aquaticus]UBM60096.1 DUF6089 family protein [Marinilongibacter aquaticus]